MKSALRVDELSIKCLNFCVFHWC